MNFRQPFGILACAFLLSSSVLSPGAFAQLAELVVELDQGLPAQGTTASIGSFVEVPELERVFFTAETPETGWEVWTSDGTSEGTRILGVVRETEVGIRATDGEHRIFAADRPLPQRPVIRAAQEMRHHRMRKSPVESQMQTYRLKWDFGTHRHLQRCMGGTFLPFHCPRDLVADGLRPSADYR